MSVKILFVLAIRDPYLVRLIDLNDFVTVKYRHIINCVCLLLAYPAIQSMLQLGKINKPLPIYL